MNLQHHIQSAVQIFRAHPGVESEEIFKLIMEIGVDQRLAVQLLILVPLAYGRVMLSDKDVLFPNTYLCRGSKRRLDELPLWPEALEFARLDREPFYPIAIRSPEVRAVNNALLNGETFESLIFAPPGFLWSIEAIPGMATPKQPGWLRRIWDEPAEYTMTHRTRAAARVTMVVGILVGLLAIGVVGYYALSVLQAK